MNTSGRVGSLFGVLTLYAGLLIASAPSALADTGDPTGVTAVVQGLNVDVSWSADSDPSVTDYLVSTQPESPTVDVRADATSATLTGVRPGVSYVVSVTAVRSGVDGNQVAAASPVTTVAPGGSFVGLPPTRLLDTRAGVRGVPAASSAVVQVTGRGGVPSTGVSAVALNVTATQPVNDGYVTVYPAGAGRPVASNLNFKAGQTVANLVIVPVGAGGKVNLFSSSRVYLIADVSGYFTTTATASPTSGLFHAVQPTRVMDTRNGFGASTPGPGETVKIQVTGQGGVPAANVSAVVLNTTIAGSTGSGFVTTYPTGTTRPNASTLGFVPKQIVANRTIVPVGTDGSVNFFNSSGRTPLVIDVTGWFTADTDDSATGSYFVPMTPVRIVDTRIGLGAAKAPLGTAGTLPVTVAGSKGIPLVSTAMPAMAAVTTVAFVNSSQTTYGTIYPSVSARPLASDLNVSAGATVPNLSLSGLGADGKVAIFNQSGNSNVIVDLSGYFIGEIHVPTSTLVVKPGVVKALSGDPGTSATVTLAAGGPVPAVGQIITSTVTPQTPNGLLVKVVSVTTDGNNQSVVTTEPATLQEAIGSGELSISAPLSGADVIPAGVPQLPRVLTADELSRRQAAARPATPVTGAKKRSACSGDAGSYVETAFSIMPTLNIDIKLGWSYFNPTVNARAYAQIQQTASAGFSFGGKVECKWDLDLAKYTFPTLTFDVGPVPVVIVPQLTMKLKADIAGQAIISSSVSQVFTAKAGLTYNGSKVTPINEVSNKLTFQPLALTQANASASVALVAEVVGKLYGVTGPTITVTATLTATVDLQATPWWSLIFTLTAHAGLHFDISILHVDVSTQEFTLYRKVLAQAGGNPLPTTNIRVTFDGTLGLDISDQYQAYGILFGGDPLPYLASDRSNPTSPVLSGGSGFGSTLYGSFVNPDGSARSVSTMTLDVGYIDNPGSTEVLAYDSNGTLLVTAVADQFGIDTITIDHAGIQFFIVRSTGIEGSGWAIDNVIYAGFLPANRAGSTPLALGRPSSHPAQATTRTRS